MNTISKLVQENRAGHMAVIPSVCTAQADVIAAAIEQANTLGRDVLIEATSNQVNQFGGYTGMTPAQYIDFVRDMGLDMSRVHFGGDHLGPQAWRDRPAAEAMDLAREMMKAYVQAGFTKIHLDCSEPLADDGPLVDDQICAERAADLAAVCEANAPDVSKLIYIIGTEVPPPGGARVEDGDAFIEPTDPERAKLTIACHQKAFAKRGLGQDVWDRVVGLVVQPGLEFAPTHIDHFDMSQPNQLTAALEGHPNLCFEAHSTDYQLPAVYPDLVRRNFAILKIGPALTFAYRQALYALDHLRHHLIEDRTGIDLEGAMESLMLENPSYWQGHYTGQAQELKLQRHFGYADRIRYYWPHPKAQQSVQALMNDLSGVTPPRPLLEQYFEGALINGLDTTQTDWAKNLVKRSIQATLAPYFVE